ncbi:MAG: hypothetical protein LBG48_04045 [Rickettsiales bacterium]|nr:hypothetical protein [Rickettsiales bacterium]
MNNITREFEPICSEEGDSVVRVSGSYCYCPGFYKDEDGFYYYGEVNKKTSENETDKNKTDKGDRYKKVVILDYQSEEPGFCIKDVYIRENEYQDVVTELDDHTIKVAYDIIRDDKKLISREKLERHFGEDKLKTLPPVLLPQKFEGSNILDITPEEISRISDSNENNKEEYKLKEKMSRFLSHVFMVAAERGLRTDNYGLPNGLFSGPFRDSLNVGNFLELGPIESALENIFEKITNSDNHTRTKELFKFCGITHSVTFEDKKDLVEDCWERGQCSEIKVFSRPFFEALFNEDNQSSSFSRVVNFFKNHFVSMGGAIKKIEEGEGAQKKSKIEIAMIISDSMANCGELNGYEKYLLSGLSKYGTAEGIKKNLLQFLVELCEELIVEHDAKKELYLEGNKLFSEIKNFFISSEKNRLDTSKSDDFLISIDRFIEKFGANIYCIERRSVISMIKKGIEFLKQRTEDIEVKFHPFVRINGSVEGCSKQAYAGRNGSNACALFATRSAAIIEGAVKNPRFFEKITELERQATRKQKSAEKQRQTTEQAVPPSPVKQEKKEAIQRPAAEQPQVAKKQQPKAAEQSKVAGQLENRTEIKKTNTYPELPSRQQQEPKFLQRHNTQPVIRCNNTNFGRMRICEEELKKERKELFKKHLLENLKKENDYKDISEKILENVFEEAHEGAVKKIQKNKIEILSNARKIEFLATNFDDSELLSKQIYDNILVEQIIDTIEGKKNLKKNKSLKKGERENLEKEERKLEKLLDFIINEIEGSNHRPEQGK